MPFVPLYALFPEVAERETRVLTVPPGTDIGLPPAEYSFIEMFCDEKACDCRRAFFTVFSLPAKQTEGSKPKDRGLFRLLHFNLLPKNKPNVKQKRITVKRATEDCSDRCWPSGPATCAYSCRFGR